MYRTIQIQTLLQSVVISHSPWIKKRHFRDINIETVRLIYQRQLIFVFAVAVSDTE